MLNKSQWNSIYFFLSIISLIIAFITFKNNYDSSDDILISLAYSSIPLVLVTGLIYTSLLRNQSSISIKTYTIKFLKWLRLIFLITVISIAFGFAFKIPYEIGIILYNKYTFNENVYKKKYAKDRTWGSLWGLQNIKFSYSTIEELNFGEDMVYLKATMQNNSSFPLTTVYVRVIAFENKEDTLYDEIIGIDSDIGIDSNEPYVIGEESVFKPLTQTKISWILPKSFMEIYYSKLKVEFQPYGGKISELFLNNISQSNLTLLLSKNSVN